MNIKRKTQSFNPAALPMEYLPRIPYAFDDKHTRHYLIPGRIFVAAQPFAISTIVGSSVALCLWDSSRGSDNATRYANVANPALLQRMLGLGAEIKTMEAKIFGGSLTNVSFGSEHDHLGERNVQAVTHFLNMSGIRLAHSEVGGTHGRKVIFHTDDGRVWAEQL